MLTHPPTFDFARLLEPATLLLGDKRITAEEMRALRTIARAVARAWESSFGRKIASAIEDPRAESTSRSEAPAFAVRLRGASGTLDVYLEAEVARGLAEAVAGHEGGFRRPDSLSDAERGVLQYGVLRVLDELAERHGSSIGIEAFLDRERIAETWANASDPWVFRVWIRGRTGRVFVSGHTTPHWPRENEEVEAEMDPNAELQVRLAFPTLAIEREELASARLGDLILLGASNWNDWAESLHLVTTTGWRLARVRVAEDGPRAVRLECASLTPCSEELHNAPRGFCVLRAYLGTGRLPLERLLAWEADQRLELSKPVDTPILVVTDEASFEGELVLASGEFAIHLVRRVEERP